uniref:Glycine-rich protein n=1 Tax=Fagus sylvatica TaxID=28930 RepID=A0A2N9EKR6_FAGSY
MAKMAATSATKFMVLAVLVAILMLLMPTEVATAVVDNAVPQLKLGRRLLEADYNTAGRGGYNNYNTDGRGGYN